MPLREEIGAAGATAAWVIAAGAAAGEALATVATGVPDADAGALSCLSPRCSGWGAISLGLHLMWWLNGIGEETVKSGTLVSCSKHISTRQKSVATSFRLGIVKRRLSFGSRERKGQSQHDVISAGRSASEHSPEATPLPSDRLALQSRQLGTARIPVSG